MSQLPLSNEQAQEAVDAYEESGHNSHQAAKALGMHHNTFANRLQVARNRGINSSIEKQETIHGYNPAHDMTHVVASPLIVSGLSSYYNKDKVLGGQWVKSKLSDQLLQEHIKTIIKTLAKSVEGMSPLVKMPKRTNNDLLCAYVMGDPHFGMYAWARESGDDFDMEIARRISIAAVNRLIDSSPAADTAMLLSVGDTLHADNQANTTTAGTGVDTDTRFSKVLEITIETLRYMILRLLSKHRKVILRLVKGNHDTHSHLALGFALKGYFHNNKRVEIDIDPADFWYYKFGKVLIASTHGDKTKQENLLGVMVSDRPEWVGETLHRYFYTGHIHHQTVKELAGLTCESFQTLAPKDAWHSGKGYRSGRSMICIVHHKEHGEIERHRCGIRMTDEK